MSKVEQLAQTILGDLLADFGTRNLTAIDLSNGYIGGAIPELKERCCAQAQAPPVDFGLALKDLEDAELIQTGPVVPFDNPSNSSLLIIGVRSKYEYASLTEKGYKAAQRTGGKKSQSFARVHISGGTFHQSPIGIGTHVTQTIAGSLGDAPVLLDLRKAIEIGNVEPLARVKLLAGLEDMQQAQSTPSFIDRYKDFIALAANHMTIVAPFLPALSALLTGTHP